MQQKKRDEEAASHLRSLRQHITDALAVYSLKSAELVVDVLRQLTLPAYYLSEKSPPSARTKSVLIEVLVCFLELIQNEWETTVTSLHTTKNSGIQTFIINSKHNLHVLLLFLFFGNYV